MKENCFLFFCLIGSFFLPDGVHVVEIFVMHLPIL